MSRKTDLKKLMAEHYRHLQILKEQEAGYGRLNVPTHLVTQIQDREAEIARLQTELATLEEIESGSPEPTSTNLLRTASPQPLSSKLLKLWRDPIWRISGVLVVLIVVAGVVYSFYKANEHKAQPVGLPGSTKPLGTIAAVSTPPIPIEPTLTSASVMIPTYTPTSGSHPTIITASDGSPMVRVPAGPFQRGSASGDDDEKPVRTVWLNTFYIDQFEITNAQFAAFLNHQTNQKKGGVTMFHKDDMDAKIYQLEEGGWQAEDSYANHPVGEVTWFGAKEYCELRKDRLPTEAEWEKAARGTDGRTYPWGEDLDCDHAQYGNCRESERIPVGNLPAGVSPYGLYDMAGNVSEWVADWYDADYYSNSPSSNPQGPQSGEGRVIRGGRADLSGDSVRAANRAWGYPTGQGGDLGFRCARSSP